MPEYRIDLCMGYFADMIPWSDKYGYYEADCILISSGILKCKKWEIILKEMIDK